MNELVIIQKLIQVGKMLERGELELSGAETDIKYYLEQYTALRQTAIARWVAFDWNKIETRPTEYGKYLICRKDGKIHWETWNGSGFAYNNNEIRFWAVIMPPFC